MAEHSESDVVDAAWVAEQLGVHIQTAQRYFREDGLPGRKVGRTWQTTRAAFDQWLTAGNAPAGRHSADVPAGRQLPPLETK